KRKQGRPGGGRPCLRLGLRFIPFFGVPTSSCINGDRMPTFWSDIAMTDPNVWDNPLVGRYASPEMARLWSPQRKFGTWRRLWLALAEAEHELGLLADDGKSPRITNVQLNAMRTHLDDV